MVTILSPPEQRVTLYNVSWETYERLLADLRDSSAPRLTDPDDRGRPYLLATRFGRTLKAVNYGTSA
jgi:hypothetical protein